MKVLNPRLTIQNVEGDQWVTTFEHQFGAEETIGFTVLTPKDSTLTVHAVNQAAIGRAIALLTALVKNKPD